MPTLSRINLHPVKALDPITVQETPVVGGGGLELDRQYAMFDTDGNYINGRQNDRVHRLASTFDVASETVTLWERGTDERHRFHVEDDRDDLEAWLGDFFGMSVTFMESTDRNFNDSSGGLTPLQLTAPGPTVISEGTIREVASWYPDLDEEQIERRMRANLVVEDVDPFWEDRLFADADHVVEFDVGDVRMRGVMPKPRCVTPTKDPFTGERYDGFVETFVENREEKFPDWADADYLGDHMDVDVEHYFYLTVVTRIPATEDDKTLRVGDDLDILGEQPILQIL